MSIKRGSIGAALLASALLFSLPAESLAKPGPALSRRAKLRAERAAKQAEWIKNADPQKMVTVGKRPAFFDPNNLSKDPIISAPSSILIDADTGQVLWEKNADVRRYPASTTKILTGLLLAESTQPEDVITCTNKSITQIEPSSLHIKPWEKFTSKDLLYGVMLRSGNDGAVVIAEHVSGSVPKFAERMNARARELGATSSNFVNPNGLPDPDHYTTARDLAIIARGALENPRFADAVGTPRRRISRSIVAQDSLITAKAKRMYYDKFPGADGVKTGYTRAAGHCFVGSATRDGRRLLSVVLGAGDSAIGDTIPILSWGFKRFPLVVITKKGLPAGEVPVPFSVTGKVQAVADGDLHATTDAVRPGAWPVTEIEPLRGLQAPVVQGQEVGTLVAKVDGKIIGRVSLLAGQAVERSAVGTVLTAGGILNHEKTSLLGRVAAVICGTLLLILVAFRYGTAVLRSVAVATAPAKNNRRRRNRLASSRRGDYRLR
jgi:D-alanyl-D-alanine carboxypeptidase (penicillin-binding protein 5/6)